MFVLLLFTEESIIEAVDVNGTRELETLPDSFDGRFCCMYSQDYHRQSTCTVLYVNFQSPINLTFLLHKLISFWRNCRAALTSKGNTKLTTASLNGGWVPGTSRSFHYWQPAPRWRLLPWLEKSWQPSHEPPCRKKEDRHPSH